MGVTRKAKYRLEIIAGMAQHTPIVWRGRATTAALERWVFAYADSLKAGGVNSHISKSLGYCPYPTEARIIRQKDGAVMAEWQAAPFQVY